jgi:hypothetical protein
MSLIGKPLSICDATLTSKIIGDYATLSLYYAYTYYPEKKYAYANLDISQCMVRPDYLFKNISHFISLYRGKTSAFLTAKNTHFVSMPLISSTLIKPLPLKEVDHILFLHIERELLVLRNQKKLFKNSYLLRLLFYAIFINPQISKQLLLNVIPKAKNEKLTKIVNYLSTFFN